jgi:predicted RNA methylase
LAVLDRATCEGNALSLLALGHLDRKLYADTDKALQAAGGKWNRKAKAHLFEGDAAAAIEPIILTGEIVSLKQELQQFYTPPDLARRVITLAGIVPGLTVLEPSAGRGALAAEALLAGGLVDCVEIDARNVVMLCSTPYAGVVEGDFLAQAPKRSWDRVVMNPPFTRDQDVKHVLHALRFVKAGGRLVAIMSAGITFRTTRMSPAFRGRVAEMGGTIELLPEGTFKASGTGVNTCLVVINVPERA